MRIAYLVTAYPEVSHTFIRREILELERRGHEVLRLSVRRPTSRLVDPLDQSEEAKTHFLLAQPVALALATLRAALMHPVRFARALGRAVAMGRRSDRGVVRHLAYVVEACLALRLVSAARSERVHAHFGTNSAAVAMLCHGLGGPAWTFTAHGPDEFDAPIALSLREKIADADATIAISSYGSAQLRRWARPEDWARIAIVRCTVGAEFDGPCMPIPPDSRALVSVGRLSAQKGQLLLVDAFGELLEAGGEGRLALIGDGELRAAVERRIHERGLRDAVSITGWLSGDEIRAQLRTARALVMSSFAEGLPVVLMEAFAAGRPVIATHIAGIPELVEHGASGWLVPAGDAHALSVAMGEALRAPIERLEAMGAAGQKRVRERHDTVREVDTLQRLWTAPRREER